MHSPDAGTLGLRSLLNCVLREYPERIRWSDAADGRPAVEVALSAGGETLHVPCTYRSATGHHLFGEPIGPDARAMSAGDAAVLLVARLGAGDAAGAVDLERRLRASMASTAAALAARAGDFEALAADEVSFLAAEQGLLAGHAIHPCPKSREGMSEAEERRFSPEFAAGFALRWFAVHPDCFADGHAPGATPAGQWLREALGCELEAVAGKRPDPAFRLLPVHPWQAERMARDPSVAALVGAGRLLDLGEAGAPWFATSSVRTLYRPDMPFMLKLSLGVGITNSVRINLEKELARGEDMFRFRRHPAWHALSGAYPGLALVPDPASMRVVQGGATIDGLSVSMRENPFRDGEASANVTLLAALCETLPGRGSRLGALVRRRAARGGRPEADVAREWFERFLAVLVRPVLALYLRHGIALEAHGQNLLLEIEDGWPVGARYRDNQGFFHHGRAHAALAELLPGLGEASASVIESEEIVDERVVYYFLVNSVFGIVGALGRAGVASEAALLDALRRELVAMEAVEGGRSAFVRRALAGTLRVKANMRTRLARMDELVGPPETQSVYVALANPLVSHESALADA